MSMMLMPVAAVAFCTWAVYLGGLASLQSDCNGYISYNVQTNLALPCSKAYRLPWFYMAWEIVIIMLLVGGIASGRMHHMRSAFVGLFAVATMLYIQASNTFLSAESIPYFTSGTALNRIRTTTAGAIMTATMNAIAIIACGFSGGDGEKGVDNAV